MIGKVVKIFIPKEYNNGRKVSYLDSNKIGFKIDISGEVKKFVVKQNNENANIYVNDMNKIVNINNNSKECNIFELDSGCVEKEILKLKEKLGTKYIYLIGNDMRYLSEFINNIDV